MTAFLDVDALRAALLTPDSPWAGVEHHGTIASTNARAALLGEPWQVVVAEHQSEGRGRMARRWEAPPGTSLAVSATLPLPATGAGWVPLAAGLAVVEAVETVTPLRAELKWPNDVLLPADASRKVCGILCEVVTDASHGHRGPLVVVGTGINLSQEREELPVDTATSLVLAGASDVDRTALVAAYLTALASWCRGRPSDLKAAYRQRCATLRTSILLSLPDDRTLLGDAVGVDDEGRLVVEGLDGRSAWAAGDVVHVRPPGAD